MTPPPGDRPSPPGGGPADLPADDSAGQPAGGYLDWSRAGWRAHLPDVADVPAYVAQLGAETIPELAAASADRVPDKVAVSIDGEALTHGQLDAGASQVAAWLAGRLLPGDRVLLAAGPGLGFLRCYLGSLRAGAVAVLAGPGSTAAELAHLVADSGAVVAFADRGPAQLLGALPSPPVTVDVTAQPPDAPGRAGWRIWPQPEDTALLAYTSGTTGRPKGVPLSHRQLVTSIRAAMAAWRWSGDDVLMHSLPLHHQHGLGGLHATLIAGATAHLRSRFTPTATVETVRATHASVLLGVPAIYQALLDSAGTWNSRASSGSLATLRLAVCGSAPLSPALADQLPTLLGQLPLVRYGTTESGLNVSNICGEPHAATLGVPLPGVLARIWSQDAAAAIGEDGEIQLRGPQVFHGYWQDPAADEAAFTGDGWFRTGDIGRVDPATGHLEFRGRSKEMIITGGLNVYPREVELALESHPAVAEAAVAGIPHEHWGEQVTGWVVLQRGWALDEDALIAHARTALSAYKCPKQVFAVAALPRNDLGKIVRGALTPG